MDENTIKKMYDELYNSKQQQLLKEKNSALSTMATRDKSITNQYDNTKAQLDTSKNEVSNKYKTLYTGLDTQQAEGKSKYYADRDTASYSNARNTQSIRDYMARNNLLQSGESVDALLRNNTDFSNTMGSIRSNENSFNTNIANTRNQYKGEEATNYAKLEQSLAEALKERDLNMAQLQAERADVESGYNTGLTSARSEVESQKLQALMEYQQAIAEQQAAIQAAAARSSASSGGSSRSSSSSSSSGYTTAPTQAAATNEIQTLLDNGQWSTVRNLLNSGTIASTYSKTYEDKVRKQYNANNGVSFDNSFNANRYARQSSKY